MSRRAPLALVVLATLVFASQAQAAVISREGDTIVVRPNLDELLKDVEVTSDGSTFTLASRTIVDEIGTPRSGPGCDASGAPKCAIDGATSLRVELGEGDQEALVTDSPIPVTIDGGSGRDRPEVRDTANATIIGGTGDDILKVDADTATLDGGEGDDTLEIASGTVTADGGNGDDQFEVTDADATLQGGAGNDIFLTASSRSPERQTISCGSGSDAATVDSADVLLDGCGPAFRSLTKASLLGRFSAGGTITLATLAKVPKAASAKVTVSGPRIAGLPKSFNGAYARGSVRLKAGAKLAPSVKPSSAIGKVLGKRKNAVTNAQVKIQLYASGKTTGDTTIVTLPGTLRPK